MRLLHFVLIGLSVALTAYATPPTGTVYRALMLDTNGVIVAPTNFADANCFNTGGLTGDIASAHAQITSTSGRVDVVNNQYGTTSNLLDLCAASNAANAAGGVLASNRISVVETGKVEKVELTSYVLTNHVGDVALDGHALFSGDAIGNPILTLIDTTITTKTNTLLRIGSDLEGNYAIEVQNQDDASRGAAYLRGPVKLGSHVMDWFSTLEIEGNVAISGYYADETPITVTVNGYPVMYGLPFSTNEQGGVQLGDGATSFSGGSIGINSTTLNGGSIGPNTVSGGGGSVGENADTSEGGAVGRDTISSDGGAVGLNAINVDGFSGGKHAVCTNEAGPHSGIQLGTGTNTIPDSMQVYTFPFMGVDGIIPPARLGGITSVYAHSAGYFRATNDCDMGVNAITNINQIKFQAGSARGLFIQTADNSDIGILNLSAGGAASAARGAYITLGGNEATSSGSVSIVCGNSDLSTITMRTSNNIPRVIIERPGCLNVLSNCVRNVGALWFATGGALTNMSDIVKLIGSTVSWDPYTIPFAVSNNISLANGSWQYYAPTSSSTLWMPAAATNQGHALRLDINLGTNSITIATNGYVVVDMGNAYVTNVGVATLLLDKAAYSEHWRAYTLGSP